MATVRDSKGIDTQAQIADTIAVIVGMVVAIMLMKKVDHMEVE